MCIAIDLYNLCIISDPKPCCLGPPLRASESTHHKGAEKKVETGEHGKQGRCRMVDQPVDPSDTAKGVVCQFVSISRKAEEVLPFADVPTRQSTPDSRSRLWTPVLDLHDPMWNSEVL